MIVEANGGTIYCDVAGSGPPLVIPGYASTAMFADMVGLFGDAYTVIGHDVRGEGLQTDFPAEPYTLFDLADDTAAVMTHLGVERAHYLGHSHTGSLGQALALRHPERIERLVLTTTGPGHGSGDAGPELPIDVPEGLFTAEVVASELGAPDAIRQLSSLALSSAAIAQKPSLIDEVVDGVFTKVFAQPAVERAHMWGAYAAFNVREQLKTITAPTLVVTSKADRMTAPEDAWFMWQEIPNAMLVALNGVGHAWFLEAPEMVATVIRSFLRGDFDPTYT